MRIQAVSFDIGGTLVKYNSPLNWEPLYEPALKQACESCGLPLSQERIKTAINVLAKYNTRENPREREVDSQTIFKEIFDAWNRPYDGLDAVRAAFYGFFQADAVCYGDAEEALRRLKLAGLKIGALTDVAYGMDNSFSLRDIAPIRHYFDIILTSVDVGYRKPHAAGFSALLNAFKIPPSHMIYVGDEQKDIAGANALGVVSALIDRNGAPPDWGQSFTVQSLLDVPGLL